MLGRAGMLGRAREVARRVDDAVEARLERARGRAVLDRTMYAASELGDWSLVWHLVGLSQAVLPGRDPLSAVRLSVILGVESALVNGGIKQLFRRARPEWTSAD